MEKVTLGNTDLLVSKICFGTLTMGPLQKNLSIDIGADLLCYAYENGINFVDTAELYDTYKYINQSMKRSDFRPIISTKSYAYDKKTAQFSLQKALKELEVDYIDIFMLHEQESELTIKGHFEAIEYFLNAKEKGYVKHIGISTHNISGVKAALKYDEIEIIHPIFNFKGLGIVDGDIYQMKDAIKEAYNKGKGIIAMKIFGGGHLLNEIDKAYNFIFSTHYIHSVAIGMQNKKEIDFNLKVFRDKKINFNMEEVQKNIQFKKLHIEDWCISCGECIKWCHQNALSIKMGKLFVDEKLCLKCGYCGAHCKHFALKII